MARRSQQKNFSNACWGPTDYSQVSEFGKELAPTYVLQAGISVELVPRRFIQELAEEKILQQV